MNEELFIDNIYIPLSKSINPSLTKSITDIQEPDTRKSTFSKTTRIPNSKEAQEAFGKIFDLNLVDSTFDPTKKVDCLYLVNGDEILRGYCQLKAVVQLNDKDIEYDIVMFGSISNIFREMDQKYLDHPDMVAVLDEWNHPFTKEIQAFSWATQVYNGDLAGFVPFALGTGYVYPLADYGLTTNLNEFSFYQLPCCLYAKEYVDAIFESNGFTYSSAFFNSTYFKSLIVPGSPTNYQLTAAQIEANLFSANTPQLTSTGSTTSNNLPTSASFSTPDTIIFTNEISDPSGLYDNTTGAYTVVSSNNAGVFDINALVDINATFTPATGTSVVTTSDIEVHLGVYLNGTEIMSKAIWITFDDYPSTFSVGARSTSTTPTYPDTDYLDVNSLRYSQVSSAGIANLLPRAVNPPDRVFLTVNNVTLVSGDVIEIKWKGRYRGLNGNANHMFEDNFGNSFPGSATIDISVGSFYNTQVNTYPVEGSTMQIEKIIPKEVKQRDFFMSLVKMFNLWVDVDPLNETNLIIEPREDFLGTVTLNIEEKLAHDRELEIIPMGRLDSSDFLFTYKEDRDYYNEKYTSDWLRIYGDRRVESSNDFVNSEKKVELVFSPTPIVAPPNNDRPIPTIIGLDDQGQPKDVKHNIRIWYYGGLKPSLNTWDHINFVSVFQIPNPTSYTTYPYAGHWDDPYTPTEDINFGLTKEVYYDDNINTITITNNNLYNKYYSEMINQYTDKESKIVTGWFNVRPSDFKNWSFDKLYWFENAYFRLQKIENYNPTGNELTKCTFLYLTDIPDFIPTTTILVGQDDKIPPTGGGDIDDGETTPVKGTKNATNPDFNNTTGRGVDIMGNSNFVANDAYYIDINGDGNKVYSEASNIEIQGDNNIINPGIQNVTLINTNDLTIDESDVTYINGVKIDPTVIGLPLDVEEVNTDTTVQLDVLTYEVRTSAGDVTMTFDLSSITYVEGQTWNFKKMDKENEVIVETPGVTIDGKTEVRIKKQYTSIAVQFDGTNFIII